MLLTYEPAVKLQEVGFQGKAKYGCARSLLNCLRNGGLLFRGVCVSVRHLFVNRPRTSRPEITGSILLTTY